MTSARPVVGQTYNLRDQDYRYGLGSLEARVTRVFTPVDFGVDGVVEVWWDVEAVCKAPGMTGQGQERALYIRATAVR